MDNSSIKAILAVQITLAFLAILILLFSDFGGYYYQTSYIEVWSYIYLGSGLLSSALLIIAIVSFAETARSALMLFKNKKPSKKDVKYHAIHSMIIAAIPLTLSILGGLAIILTNLGNEWWLSVGFYGATIGGIGIIALSYLLIKPSILKYF